MTTCTFDPRTLAGLPMGQMHCECGCMILAGMEHPPCEDDCPEQDDADRAVWAAAMEPQS